MGSSQKPIHRIKQFNFDYPNKRLACEHPQRQIYLSQFEIGIYLVTNHQFGFSVDNTDYQAREGAAICRIIHKAYPFMV